MVAKMWMSDDRGSRLFWLIVVIAIAGMVGIYRYKHDVKLWSSDSAIYLRMTLEARGVSAADAKTTADRFMLTTISATPEVAALYGANPPPFYVAQAPLFRTRPIFPHLSALLYGRFGPNALKIVSYLAYLAGTAAFFCVLLLAAPGRLAALGALALATSAPVLNTATLALTDSTALLFWICVLGLTLAYLRRPHAALLALLGVSALALTFTRPDAYLAVGLTTGAWFALRNDQRRRGPALIALAVTVGAGLVFSGYIVLIHGTGLLDQLRWQHDWRLAVGDPSAAHGFARWYVVSLARIVGQALTYDVYRNGALLVLALALYGAIIGRRSIVVAALIGSVVGASFALLANPSEFVRSVELPLAPVVIFLAIFALRTLDATAALDADGTLSTGQRGTAASEARGRRNLAEGTL